MIWRLSRFRAGALVEVRSKEEILATLDEHGCVDGLPFMPEMFAFCGQHFQVRSVAHKTCDTAHRTWHGRRLQATVHLADLRCDGTAHGGCQAACSLFWKDAWLKPADDDVRSRGVTLGLEVKIACDEAQLLANTRSHPTQAEEELRYYCQATNLYEATEPLAWWDVRQYFFDILTGNQSVGRVVRRLWLAMLRAFLRHTPIAWSLVKSFQDWNHLWLTGLPTPSVAGKVRPGERTPSGRLTLEPGEWVRIKSQAEIENTLTLDGKNRGMSFDPSEMAQYCGRAARVRRNVVRLIEEPTGKMLEMKEPCIMLEGVVCNGENSTRRLNCPRQLPSFWRELWLERVNATEADQGMFDQTGVNANVERHQ